MCVWSLLLPMLSDLPYASTNPPPLYSSTSHIHVFLVWSYDTLSLALCVTLGMELSNRA